MQAHIEACQTSGQKVIDYCKAQNINKGTYYYWYNQLHTNSSGNFTKVEVGVEQTNSKVRVAFTNGIQIHFEQLPQASYLKQIIN